MKNGMEVPKKLELPYDLTILYLGIYSKQVKAWF
jgi:hypothetical protein